MSALWWSRSWKLWGVLERKLLSLLTSFCLASIFYPGRNELESKLYFRNSMWLEVTKFYFGAPGTHSLKLHHEFRNPSLVPATVRVHKLFPTPYVRSRCWQPRFSLGQNNPEWELTWELARNCFTHCPELLGPSAQHQRRREYCQMKAWPL